MPKCTYCGATEALHLYGTTDHGQSSELQPPQNIYACGMCDPVTFKAGTIIRLHHERKGSLTVRLLVDVTPATDAFQCELMAGRPAYASVAMRLDGARDPGDVLSMRQCLVTWLAYERPQP